MDQSWGDNRSANIFYEGESSLESLCDLHCSKHIPPIYPMLNIKPTTNDEHRLKSNVS